jgi:hypothetical protein
MSDQATVDLGVGNLVTCRGITGTNATGDCTILVQPEAYGTYIPGLKEAAAGSSCGFGRQASSTAEVFRSRSYPCHS